jgi:GH35 family endo-1,4-beta-xylanase
MGFPLGMLLFASTLGCGSRAAAPIDGDMDVPQGAGGEPASDGKGAVGGAQGGGGWLGSGGINGSGGTRGSGGVAGAGGATSFDGGGNPRKDQWLVDPGFEVSGTPAWNGDSLTTPGHSGNQAVTASSSAGTSVLVSQDVALNGYNAASLTLSVWVRTENVVLGPGGWECARSTIEYYDASGKLIDGYPGNLACVTGTTPWTEYSGSSVIPIGTATIRVVLGLPKGASGNAWFDDANLSILPPSTDDNVTVPTWTPPAGDWCARPGYGLGTAMDAHLRMGPTELHPNDPEYPKARRVARELFTQLTLANSTKWGNRAYLNGQAGTQIVLDALAGSGTLVKGHVALWHEQLPPPGQGYASPDDVTDIMVAAGFGITTPWLSYCRGAFQANVAQATRDALIGRALAHVTSVVTDFGGVALWDVFNEIAASDNQCWPSAFAVSGDTELAAGARALGAVLDAADNAQPIGIHLYNEYGVMDYLTTSELDYNQARVLNLVKQVIATRGHVDGLGTQAHLTCGAGANTSQCDADVARLQSALDAFMAAGVPVYLTEFDVVKERATTNGTATIVGTIPADQQAKIYADFVRAALNHPAVLGVTLWGHKQDRMWGTTARNTGESDASYWARGPGLYDDQYNPKPAYSAIVQVLQSYYANEGCAMLPANRFAKVTGQYTIAAHRFAQTGPVALRTQGESVSYLFHSPYAGHWQLELELERDLPGSNSFDVTVDGANATTVSLDSSQAQGTVSIVPVFTAPIPLSRGVHIVHIAYGPDAFTCGDAAWSDDCDGNGILRGLRLRRVGP